MAAAAAIALGMAGPVIRDAAAPPTLHVLLDTSPSMSAFEGRADEALEKISLDVERRDRNPRVRIHRRDRVEDVVAILATAGDGDVVVITDHRPEGIESAGRIRLVLVGEPVENVGFSSAWAEGKRFVAVVTNHGTKEREVVVVTDAGRVPLTIPAGESRRATGEAPRGSAVLRLEPGDRFSFDDEVRAEGSEPLRRRLTWRGADEPRLRTALESAGVEFVARKGNVAYRSAPIPADVLVVAPPGRIRAVDGTVVTGAALESSSAPPTGAVLGDVSVLEPGGTVLLADRTGPLAVRRPGGRIEVALDPGHASSTWFRDPSFPIFWAVVGHLAGSEGKTLPEPWFSNTASSESATRGESLPVDLVGLTPSSPPPPGERAFARWLLLLGAVLLAFHVWLERRASQ